MCRKDHLKGCILLGLGLGLLIGQCLESGFLCTCGGFAILIIGVCCLTKK